MDVKPGLSTTEFWITLFTSVFAILDLTGVFKFQSQDAALQLAQNFAVAAVDIVAIVSYIMSRTTLKQQALLNAQVAPQVDTPPAAPVAPAQ